MKDFAGNEINDAAMTTGDSQYRLGIGWARGGYASAFTITDQHRGDHHRHSAQSPWFGGFGQSQMGRHESRSCLVPAARGRPDVRRTYQWRVTPVTRSSVLFDHEEGHPLTGDNLRIGRSGRRTCRACHRYYQRNRPSSGRHCTAGGCDRMAENRLRTDGPVCERHYQADRRAAKRAEITRGGLGDEGSPR